jgi:hypothetical protein
MNSSLKVIARIRGGLGNQLFCYAAARRLAVVNNAELVIDDVTGFARDDIYRRKYALDAFSIPARKASPAERMEPFERARRGIAKFLASRRAFADRRYIVEQGPDFDERLVSLKLRHSVYLDGLWQSEGYFKDIEATLRQDLAFKAPQDQANRSMAERMLSPSAVSVHVRWFDAGQGDATNNMSRLYYRRAIEKMESTTPAAHYFVFSDRPKSVGEIFELPEKRYTVVSQNQGDSRAYADMWLMTKCSKHIIANSTFSWWGAWLSDAPTKVVLCPGPDSTKTNWNFKGLVPADWTRI